MVFRMQRSIHSVIKLILVKIHCALKRLLGMGYICWPIKHFFTLKKIDTQTSIWSQERHRTIEDANIQQLCLKCVVFIAKYKFSRGCGNDSVFKSIGCSSRDPGFDSQQTHGESQASLTLIPVDLTASFHLCV